MPLSSDTLTLAIRNIAQHGDTDVYPFPIENNVFYDAEDKVVPVLQAIDSGFKQALDDYPPFGVKSLASAGHAGFRAPTQIDPIWNAYLLALVIDIADDIEAARLPPAKNAVFSYRYAPDPIESTLFNKDLGWRQFHEASIEQARQFKFVLVTDIADFYPRIYHHRLENALKKACSNEESICRIMRILDSLSDGVSYGLPIGGPASRLLSELLLNRTDRLLATEGITFCRFVDDVHVFADSREEAYSHLLVLSQALLENEGLALQKTKTRIMSSEEFITTSPYAAANEDDSEAERTERAFLKVRLRYDPYSPTADDDYEALKKEVSQFDVLGLLGKQLRKTQIDETLTKQLVRSITFLPPDARDNALILLADNLNALYPIFSLVAIILKKTMGDSGATAQSHVFAAIRKLARDNSHMLRVSTNLAYAIRIFAMDPAEEAEMILADLYKRPLNMMLKRDIILAMARRNADYWVSNCRKQFSTLNPWERRAMIVASFILADEGRHWRAKVKKRLTDAELLVLEWAKSKNKSTWEIPL